MPGASTTLRRRATTSPSSRRPTRSSRRSSPGEGPLGPRIEAASKGGLHSARERSKQTLRAALEAARAADAPFVKLPGRELRHRPRSRSKPWGAYNWYLGNFKSRIELNTDLPTELNGIARDDVPRGVPRPPRLQRAARGQAGEGARLGRVHRLSLFRRNRCSPREPPTSASTSSFRTTSAAASLTEVLGPAAGVPADAILALDRVRDAMKPLKYVSGEAARMLLDEGKSPKPTRSRFVGQWGLVTEDSGARSPCSSRRTYRSVRLQLLARRRHRSPLDRDRSRPRRPFLRHPVAPRRPVGLEVGTLPFHPNPPGSIPRFLTKLPGYRSVRKRGLLPERVHVERERSLPTMSSAWRRRRRRAEGRRSSRRSSARSAGPSDSSFTERSRPDTPATKRDDPADDQPRADVRRQQRPADRGHDEVREDQVDAGDLDEADDRQPEGRVEEKVPQAQRDAARPRLDPRRT